MLGKNTHAAGLFDVEVKPDKNGHAKMSWKKIADRRDWATLSTGCYLLRSNDRDWSDEELWKAYIQLTEAEAAFRIHKSDLSIRPIWHQKEDRVLAHILVFFLALLRGFIINLSKAGVSPKTDQTLARHSDINLTMNTYTMLGVYD